MDQKLLVTILQIKNVRILFLTYSQLFDFISQICEISVYLKLEFKIHFKMCIGKQISPHQQTIFNKFVDAFEANSEVEISVLKSRISFKKANVTFNYFILFCHKDGFYLHMNERNMKSDRIIVGFTRNCFNSAKKYQQCEIRNINDAEKAIQLINNNINF